MYQGIDDGLPYRLFRISPSLLSSRSICKRSGDLCVASYKFHGLFDESVFNNPVFPYKRRHRAAYGQTFLGGIIFFFTGISDGINTGLRQESVRIGAKKQQARHSGRFSVILFNQKLCIEK